MGRCASLALAALVVPAGATGAQSHDQWVQDLVGSEDEEARRAAIEGLSAFGGYRTWLIILHYGFEDESALVGDQTQLAVARLRDPNGIERLLGDKGLRARQNAVQVRAAEALGRLPVPIAAGALAPALQSRIPEMRRMALWSLERLARESRLSADEDEVRAAVAKVLERDKDDEVRGAALLCLAALDEEAALDVARRSLREEVPPAVKVGALQLLRAVDDDDLEELAAWLLRDGSFAVREEAVRCLGEIATAEAASSLVDFLEVERSERVAWEAALWLRGMTGAPLGRDPGGWRRWLEGSDGAWEGTSHRAELEHAPTGVSFAGLNVVSDRVAFLIDLSEEMGDERGGAAPKDVAARELRAALEHLAPAARFNVVPFGDDAKPWKKELAPADETNVARAADAFDRARAKGRADFWGAHEAALADPEVDTLVVFTRGELGRGEHRLLPLVAELVAERHRYRRVRVEAVLTGADGELVAAWKALCGPTGGRCVALDR